MFRSLLDEPEFATHRAHKKHPLCRAMRAILGHLDRTVERCAGENLPPRHALMSVGRRLLEQVELVEIHAPTEADAFRLFEDVERPRTSAQRRGFDQEQALRSSRNIPLSGGESGVGSDDRFPRSPRAARLLATLLGRVSRAREKGPPLRNIRTALEGDASGRHG